MKTIKLLSLLALVVLIAQSCGTDDGPVTPKPVEQVDPMEEEASDPMAEETPQEAETPEEEPSNEPSNNITENIIITGSEKVDGAPPTPNGAISLDLSAVTKTGLPEEGFDIVFASDTDVVGAYIQFKATATAVADSYFDVDLLANAAAPEPDSKSKSRFNSKSKEKRGLTRKMLIDSSINIDFTPQLQTGEFCYVICVYDAAGNISNPEEVCVTVNSWGGNNDFVGTWNLTRNEDISEDGTDTETVGVEECNEPIGNEKSFTCSLIEFWTLKLNSEGTFEYTLKEFFREAPIESEFVDFDLDTLSGNWSYDPTTEELLFVTYFEEYEENGVVVESETYAVGDGDLSPVQRLVVDAASLKLVWDEVDTDGDGNINESYIEYYERQ